MHHNTKLTSLALFLSSIFPTSPTTAHPTNTNAIAFPDCHTTTCFHPGDNTTISTTIKTDMINAVDWFCIYYEGSELSPRAASEGAGQELNELVGIYHPPTTTPTASGYAATNPALLPPSITVILRLLDRKSPESDARCGEIFPLNKENCILQLREIVDSCDENAGGKVVDQGCGVEWRVVPDGEW